MASIHFPEHESLIAAAGGFTLIELLVVIAIIGYLSVIGINSFQRTRAESRDARRESDLSQIYLGLKLYYDDAGIFPTPENNDPDGSSAFPAGSIFSFSDNPIYPAYVSGVMYDPINSGTQEYRYVSSSDRQKFTLCTPAESEAGVWYNVYENGQYEKQAACNTARL